MKDHPLYLGIRTTKHIRIFMESHVYAVWDFMSLLKSLQRGLTCVETPWRPSAFPASRRFINEIVLGEESDLYNGRPISHFELYLEAMEQAEADTLAIRQFAGNLPELDMGIVPADARRFVQTTFALIERGSLPARAAAFTFGREDAIPEMFRSLVRELDAREGALSTFIWYLERHIEVDGEDHGPLSLRMVSDLCGDDPALWQEAGDAAEDAIRARLAIWDGIHGQILQQGAD